MSDEMIGPGAIPPFIKRDPVNPTFQPAKDFPRLGEPIERQQPTLASIADKLQHIMFTAETIDRELGGIAFDLCGGRDPRNAVPVDPEKEAPPSGFLEAIDRIVFKISKSLDSVENSKQKIGNATTSEML